MSGVDDRLNCVIREAGMDAKMIKIFNWQNYGMTHSCYTRKIPTTGIALGTHPAPSTKP